MFFSHSPGNAEDDGPVQFVSLQQDDASTVAANNGRGLKGRRIGAVVAE